MLEILSFYQNLPQKINPVAWRLGEVEIYWYSLAWVLAVLTAWGIAFWRIKKAEAPAEFDGDFLEKVVLWGLVGALLGGRLGYVLLYRPDFFLSDPWSIVSPFDSNGRWIGLRGMSFFGGLAGLAASLSLLARQSRIGFWKITDFIAPAAAAGYFWGRVGNFLGGELYGSPTDKPWGMYFDGQLRHPSQIYEATLEGAVLFWLLWKIRNKDPG
ncbi:MAG TPA: prolipoprotein diacylglyceryl transferase, partial [Candidatus Moranbacteria bacterium]|nr:prolipoprotein diacylglyceryl transferase [Candidatus Moranbacteria bacterium]